MPDAPERPPRYEHLKLFSQLSRIIARTTDIDELARSSIDIILSILAVENCSIMLMNAEGDALTMLHSSAIPREHWNRIRVSLGYGAAGKVAQSGKPLLITKIVKDESRSPHLKEARYYTDSFVSIPLFSADRKTLIGVINATDRTNREPMTSADLKMLEAIGDIIAGAIESHRAWVTTHEARLHLSQVMDGLPIGMFTISADGKLSLCNRAARDYLNLPSSIETIDQPWQECFPPLVADHIQHALRALARGRSTFSEEFEIPGAEDEPPRSVRVSALEAEEFASIEASHALFLVEDLQQMQELAELRRSDLMKSNFLSLISHELRTPLAAIKGAIHLLNQMAPPEMQRSAHGIFCILHRNNDRLTRVVNNILDVMDLETGSLNLYRKRTDLHALTTRITDRFLSAPREKSVRWTIRLEATRPEIYVDESRVGQVIDHLIENALKFAIEGSDISIVTASRQGEWLLNVTNVGPEISTDFCERIFSRFFQVDDSLTRETGGSGVGLFLCREIMRLHGGNISLDANFKGGARFTVSLPETGDLA